MSVMEAKDRVHYIAGVDDGTGVNPQEGYFVIYRMEGPFKTADDAKEYLFPQLDTKNKSN